MKCIYAALLFVALLLSTPAQALRGTAYVLAVIDGDTLLLQPTEHGTRIYKLRLAGIDAPEMNQPYGMEAKQALAAMVLHKTVVVATVATDRYGRRVGWVGLDASMGDRFEINADLVRRGAAWASNWHRRDARLTRLQRDARRERRGLWVDGEPLPPWVWRRRAAAEEPTSAFASKPLLFQPRD
jgi:micrococcal nuclease